MAHCYSSVGTIMQKCAGVLHSNVQTCRFRLARASRKITERRTFKQLAYRLLTVFILMNIQCAPMNSNLRCARSDVRNSMLSTVYGTVISRR